MAEGPHGDALADADGPRQDLSRIAAKVLTGPEHELHRQPKRLARDGAIDIDRLEILEQRRTVVPRCAIAPCGDVVTVKRAQRNRPDRRSVEARGELVADAVEHIS